MNPGDFMIVFFARSRIYEGARWRFPDVVFQETARTSRPITLKRHGDQ
jgi:hypothetical protein